MFQGANDRFITIQLPRSLTAGGSVTGSRDTIGHEYCQIVWSWDTASTNPSALSITETDDTAAGFTAIAALTGDSAGGFTIPDPDTTNGSRLVMNIDLRKRKRYLGFQFTAAVATVVSSTARFARKSEILASASDMGVDAVVEV